MPNTSVQLDRIFQALADPTRRAVVQRLGSGAASTLELAKPFAMALPSFTQHLSMLERAGMVRSRKTGRVRIYRLAPKRLREAEDWIHDQRKLWEGRLDQLDAYVRTMKRDDDEQ